MKTKSLIVITFFLVVCISFLSCQKSLRGYIKVNGRVLDYFTNEPIKIRVSLMGDDVTSAKNYAEGSITLATTTTNSDGTFSLQSKPSKRGRYYIAVAGEVTKRVNVELEQNNDVGDFLAGSHVFLCNITVIPRSDSTLRLQKGMLKSDYYFFDKGTTAVVQNSITLNALSFNNFNKSFPIWYTAKSYYPSYSGTDYYKGVPITSLTSPLTATLYY